MFRKILRVALAISVAATPLTASSADYYYRYHPGVFPSLGNGENSGGNPGTGGGSGGSPDNGGGNPGTGTPGAGGGSNPSIPVVKSVTATYSTLVGEYFSEKTPSSDLVSRWIIVSGHFPDGISLTPNTGALTGVSSLEEAQTIVLSGLNDAAQEVVKASVTVESTVKDGDAQRVAYYTHTGLSFSEALPSFSNANIVDWVAKKPLPGGLVVGNTGSISGIVSTAGTYPIIINGLDTNENLVATVYGTLFVESGPSIEDIADQKVDALAGEQFDVKPVVKNALGTITYRLIPVSIDPVGITFDPATGVVGGTFAKGGLSAQYVIEAQDSVDGTTGRSNQFTLRSSYPVLDLAAPSSLRGYVGVPFERVARVDTNLGPVTFTVVGDPLPEGITVDNTGRIFGTPKKAGRTSSNLVVTASDGTSTKSATITFVVSANPLEAKIARTNVRIDDPFVTAPPNVWSGKYDPITFAAVPTIQGMSFNPSTATFASSGIHQVGRFDQDVTVNNGLGDETVATVEISVTEKPIPVYPANYAVTRLTPGNLVPKFNSRFVVGQPVFALTQGVLPDFMSFYPASGVIKVNAVEKTSASDTPYGPFVVTLTDESGVAFPSQPFTVKVNDRPHLVFTPNQLSFTQGSATAVTPLKVANGVGYVYFKITQGQFPSSLKFSEKGFFMGSTSDPAGTVYKDIIIRANDSQGEVDFYGPFDMTVVAPKPITLTASGGSGQVGLPLALEAPQVSFNTGSYSFTATGLSGTGLQIDASTGIISGTPLAAGSITSTITVTDAKGAKSSASISIIVEPGLSLATISNRAITGKQSYAEAAPVARASASKLVGSASFNASGLPQGLTINSTSGAITGVVSSGDELGNHTVSVSVTDTANGSVKVTSFTLTVVNPFTYGSYTPTAVRAGEQYSAGGFSIKDVATGGAYAGTGMMGTKVSGGLPAGMRADYANGILTFSGTPSEEGSFSSVWAVSDDSGWLVVLPSLTIVVSPASKLSVNGIGSTTVYGSQAYTVSAPLVTATAKDAVGAVTWDAQNLPAGLQINSATGAIYGTVRDPSLLGNRTVTVSASDSVKTVSTTFNLTVANPFFAASFTTPALKSSVPVNFGIPLRAPQSNAAYSNGVTATLISGTAVPGVTASITGSNFTFIGTPTTAGTYSSTWKLTDANGWNVTVTTAFTVAARPAIVVSFNYPAASNVAGQVDYTTASRAATAVVVSGQTGTITWSASLPAGLIIEPSTGIIYGKITDPAFLGSQPITLTATDTDGAQGKFTGTMLVRSPISVRNYAPTLTVGTPYTGGGVVVDLGNRNYPYTPLVLDNVTNLPPGLSVSMTGTCGCNAVFTGTPTAAGTYVVGLRVTDRSANGFTGWSLSWNWTIKVQ